jgi:N-acyl-L-homoserine lactone synthetase
MKWDALQAQSKAVLEVIDVAVRDQLRRPGVDVEVVVGEAPLRHSLVAVVTVLEVDEEILGEVLDDGDMLQAN